MSCFHLASSALRHCIAATTALLVLTSAAPALAQSIMQRIQFAGPSGQTIDAAVWTPETPSAELRPLIVMSHGNGGAFGGHQDTAEACELHLHDEPPTH